MRGRGLLFVTALVCAFAGIGYAGHKGIGEDLLKTNSALEQSKGKIFKKSGHLSSASNNASQPATTSNTVASASTFETSASNTAPTANKQIDSILLQVPAQEQGMSLYNGCEVTSLSMMLDYAGHPTTKETLADEVDKDTTEEVLDDNGNITFWGDPDRGFVGDITGVNSGYGVYHEPIRDLVDKIMPNHAIDLTGDSFDQVLKQVASGKPVVVWTTANFTPTDSWVDWNSPDGIIHATMDEHAVLLVGYDSDHVIINDPLDGTGAKSVDRNSFIEAWKQLGQQAVSYQ